MSPPRPGIATGAPAALASRTGVRVYRGRVTESGAPPPQWAPQACTLPTVERPLRAAEFDELFRSSVRRVERVDARSVRLELDATSTVAAKAADLATRETACCAFFAFDLRIGDGRLLLDVSTPEVHADVLAALADRASTLSGGQG